MHTILMVPHFEGRSKVERSSHRLPLRIGIAGGTSYRAGHAPILASHTSITMRILFVPEREKSRKFRLVWNLTFHLIFESMRSFCSLKKTQPNAKKMTQDQTRLRGGPAVPNLAAVVSQVTVSRRGRVNFLYLK